METLVSTEWLAARTPDDVVVLDASKHLPDAGRDAAADYAEAHIPGARFMDMPNLHDASASVVNTMPSAAQTAEHMAALGIGPDDAIVLYDDSQIKSSARAWFILREHGFSNVAILDGGLEKWRRENRPLESGEAGPAAVPPARLPEAERVIAKDALRSRIESGEARVVDARDAERFGQGHHPGAVNVFFRDVFEPDGTYKSPADLRALFAERGLDASQPLVTSCNSGMTASVLFFAMHRAGYDTMQLYDGSWQEWSSDPAMPVESGG